MITDGKHSDGVEERHYIALKSKPIFYNGKLCNRPVKSLPKSLREISSNHHGDFYCLNCFNSYSTENRLKQHEEICNKNDSCRIIMPRWDEKILFIQSLGKIIKSPICNLS